MIKLIGRVILEFINFVDKNKVYKKIRLLIVLFCDILFL